MLERSRIRHILTLLHDKILHITWCKKDGSLRSANIRCRKGNNFQTLISWRKDGNNYISVQLMGNEKGIRTLNLNKIETIKCYGIKATIKD